MKLKRPGMIFLILLMLILGVGSVYIHKTNKIERERYEECYAEAEKYLKSKYIENMVIKEEYTYYDGCYRLSAYPENHEEYEFSIGVVEKIFRISDNYLTSYRIEEVKKILNPIIEKYFDKYKWIIVDGLISDKEKLEEYYIMNKKPLGVEPEYFDEVIRIEVVLDNNEDDIGNIVDSLSNEFKGLYFTIEAIEFYFINKDEVVFMDEYRLVNGEYVKNIED